jgi:hypothetical protein
LQGGAANTGVATLGYTDIKHDMLAQNSLLSSLAPHSQTHIRDYNLVDNRNKVLVSFPSRRIAVDDQHIAPGYPELFRLACANGLQELDISIVQIPSDANQQHAVVLASARTSRGLFRAVGEAYRATLPKHQHYEVLSVAELRAKASVLAQAAGLPRGVTASTPVATESPIPPLVPSSPPPAGAATPTVSMAAPAEATPRATTTEAPRPAPAPTGRSTEDAEEATPPEPARTATAPATPAIATPERARGPIRPPMHVVAADSPAEALPPEMVNRLLQMARRRALLDGGDTSEEEALRKLDSFFQRAFGHPMAEANRLEGQRVVERLANELAKLKTEHPEAARTSS